MDQIRRQKGKLKTILPDGKKNKTHESLWDVTKTMSKGN